MKTKAEKELEFEIDCFKGMLKSCHTYGGIKKDDKYLRKYKDTLGIKLFNEILEQYEKYLKENYIIEENVHTDPEGLTYNSLTKINKS
jgi:hypothetical protein